MEKQPTQPLTNVQLELLKVFAMGVSDEEVLEIRRMLARYFMQKSVKEATNIWTERQYETDTLLNEPS